ncbi:hypothetical protein JHK85_000546 [Glycine max]|nr:hypothetical protein JHK85_000546 [Glycine max]
MKGDWLELELEKEIGDAISRTRFAPHSNTLLISSWDSSLRLFDVDASLLRLQAPSQAPLLDCCFQDDAVAFAAASDGLIRSAGQLVTSGFDKKLLLWDMHMKKTSLCLRSLDAEVDSMSVSGFNVTVAIGASMLVYDLRYFDQPVESKEAFNGTHLRCVSSIPDAEGFAVGSVDGRVSLQISNPFSSNDISVSGAFATGDNEGYVTIWDAGSRRRLVELPRYPNSVASLSYNHTGQLLAVASSHTYQEAKEIKEERTLTKCGSQKATRGGASLWRSKNANSTLH